MSEPEPKSAPPLDLARLRNWIDENVGQRFHDPDRAGLLGACDRLAVLLEAGLGVAGQLNKIETAVVAMHAVTWPTHPIWRECACHVAKLVKEADGIEARHHAARVACGMPVNPSRPA